MALVYKHINLISDEVFYIGVGKSKKRPYSKSGRNKWWKNIVNKYGYKVEIIKDNISNEEARNLEKQLISYYGRRDLGTGCLVNLTNGGDGTWGYKVKDSVKRKLSKIHKGNKYRDYLPLSDDTKKLIGKSNSKVVYQYTKNNILIKSFSSVKNASLKTNINSGNISSCCIGLRGSAGGFIWKYK